MWQRLKKLLGQVQHHCRICVCLHGLHVNFVKCFSFVSEALTVHEGLSTDQGGAVPYSCTNWQESISYSSTAPLHRAWAPERAQLRKMFLLAGMAINRALPEPRGDGCLHVHSVLKDKHNTIPFILISSFWVSSSPCLVGCQDDWFCWGLPSRSSLQATVAWQKNLERRADFWGHR